MKMFKSIRNLTEFQCLFAFSVILAEPSDDWTIEELMLWCFIQSKQKTIHQIEGMKKDLEKQFMTGKSEILEIYEKIKESQESMNGVGMNISSSIVENINNENQNHNLISTEDKTGERMNTETSTTVSHNSIHIEMISGPHVGEAFLLKPRIRQTCLIGRSAGKKFRERGISLKKDPEVSTSHGKFEMKADGKLYYTDTGSTNGTFVEGIDLDVNTSLELKNGMEIMFGGASRARITIVED